MKAVGVVETKVLVITILDILDTSLIKFQSNQYFENQGKELIKIKLYKLDYQNSFFICLINPILIRENILFTQLDQNETTILNKQDKILIFPNKKQNIDYPLEYVIENSYNRNIHILNSQHTEGLYYDSYAILVKNYQNFDDDIKNNTIQQDLLFKQPNINLQSIQQLRSHSIVILIANQQKKLEIPNEVYEYNFKKKIVRNQMHNNTYAFQFNLKGVKKMNSYELHLKLNMNSQIYKDPELIFFSHPKPQIICRQYGTKGLYTQMDGRYNNKTLLDKLYWVLVDIDYERVYVGQGDTIDRNSLMLEYQLSKNNIVDSQLINNHELIVEILAHQSFGIQLNQFESIPLKDFKVQPVPAYYTKNNYTILNYSIHNLLNQQLDFDTQYIFQETYDSGTYCPAIQANRKIDILMICYQDSLLKILKITEPSICSYKMKIGTNLLCDSNQKKNFSDETSIGQRMMCVLD